MGIQQFPLPAAAGTPSGDTANRPASPVVGDTYDNGETGGLEIYSGAAWLPSSREWAADNYVPQSPTIGTATTSAGTSDVTVTWTLRENGGKPLTSISVTPFLNGTTAETATAAATTSSTSATIVGLTQGSAYTFKVKAINANGEGLNSLPTNSITVPILIEVDYLVVAGGGGGGGGVLAEPQSRGGGGGGAGGLRTSVGTSGGGGSAESTIGIPPNTNTTVTVGAGASGGNGDAAGGQGSNSVFSTITSTGGGGGASGNSGVSSTGGSGGGAANGNNGSAGTANQGFAGGNGTGANNINGGGGGGAGEAGNTDGINPCHGGDGITCSIDSIARGGGGGGGGSGGAGPAGDGGGGGGASSNNPGSPGTVNTGGGGGGAGSVGASTTGGTGGSGVVVLKYSDTKTITIGAGLTGSTATTGGFSVTTITAGTGNVSWA